MIDVAGGIGMAPFRKVDSKSYFAVAIEYEITAWWKETLMGRKI